MTIPAPRVGRTDIFHFRAALDLLEQDWGGAPGHANGAWDAMVKRVNRADGNVVISHEILAGAKPDKIAQAMNDLAGNEVHVVYSARDLGRQLPAAWQESIKQGRKWPFKRFLTKVERGQTWFFNAMDLPRVLSPVGRQAAARARARRHRPARPRPQRRRAVAALLPRLRHRPGLGARSTPSATTARSASPRPRCCASSTAASSSACGASRPTTT